MPDRPATYRDIIQHEARAAGIPPEVAFAIVDTESAGDATAVGPHVEGQGRARGFFQLMPATAQGYGVDAADPIQNIRGGIRLLADLNKQYKGDVGQMLAAYHGGQDLRQHGPKTRAYVQTVLGKLGGAAPAQTPAAGGFRADPQASAAKIGAPPPAPLPTLSRTAIPRPQQFERTGVQQAVEQVGPFVTPTLGAIAGGAIGALGGPPGAFAGGMTGGVLGEKAQIELEKAVGLPPPQAELTRLGVAAGAGLLGEGIGQGAVKLAAPFAKSVTATGKDAITALKGQVLPAQVTDHWMLDVLDNVATGALIGGGRMQKARLAQQEAVKRYAQETAERIGTTTSAEEAGQAFVSALDQSTHLFKESASYHYKLVDELTEGARVSTAPLREFITPELAKRSALPRELTGNSGRRLLADFQKLPDTITFEQANFMRGQLLQRVRQYSADKDAVATGIAKQLVKRLDAVMEDDTLAQGLSAEGQRAWRFANEFYREGHARYMNEMVRHLADTQPSKIVDALMTGRAAVEPIRAARQAIAPEAWEKVRGAATQRLVTGATDPKTGYISGDALLHQLKTFGDAGATELFGAQTRDLQKLGKLISIVEDRGGTGVGRMLVQMQQGRGLVQLGGAALGATGHVWSSLPILLAPEAFARIMTHPKGIQWLTTGIELGPTSKQGARVLGQAAALVARQPVEEHLEKKRAAAQRGVPPPSRGTLAVTLRSDGTSSVGTPPPAPAR